MANDKITIGLTNEGRQAIEKLMARNWFAEEMEAAKFGLALSVSEGLTPSVITRGDTKWNVGSFDNDGFFKALISAVYLGTDTPYKVMEYLINAGLERVAKELDAKPSLELVDLIPSSVESKTQPT